MSLLPQLRRLIAALLLLLDLSQEPGSALPLLALADADEDTISEICTEESFWCGPSADKQGICDAVRSKQSKSPIGAAAPPSTTPAFWSNRGEVAKAIITVSTENHSEVLYSSGGKTPFLLSPASDIPPAPRDLRDPSLVALMTIRLLI